VPNSNQANLTIWGRKNSVNVQKVLWCCHELDLAYQRIDAGMAFGRNGDPDYLAMNPNGRVPTLVDGDFVLWESNSIMRYLVLAYGRHDLSLYPAAPRLRASIDRWLDWTLSTLQPVDRPVFWALVRTPAAQRDMSAIQKAADTEAVQWRIVDAQLATRSFLEGEFTLADIAIGAYARRWFGVEGISRPVLPHLQRWFEKISGRAGFQQFVAPPMS
jgi:glutathione S-transferase